LPIDWAGHVMPQRRVGADVAAFIERLISSSELSPGDRLPTEREIAASLQVSRSSVRDAMSELALKGVVDRKPGRGTIIVEPTGASRQLRDMFDHERREVFQVVDLRRVIEPAIAERAAERATPGDLVHMEEVLRLAEAGGALSPAESLRLDQEFHLAVARGAQNDLLATLLVSTAEQLHKVRAKSHATKAGRNASLKGHRLILAAIQQRDAAAARDAMSSHLLDIGELVLRGGIRRAAKPKK
jgi:GntR family transcriptional repressor for pyruvate dehydrogenase complex